MKLYQDKVWVDKQDVEHRLKDMDLAYCENVLAFLERNAQKVLWGEYIIAEHWASTYDGGDMAQQSLEHASDNLMRVYAENNEDEWLAELPIVIALKKAIKKKRKKLKKKLNKEAVHVTQG